MAQSMYYRYVDEFEAAAILKTMRIEPGPGQRSKWFTTKRYERGSEARRGLALRHLPTHRIGPIPAEYMPPFDDVELRSVASANGQPGGGDEAATTRTVYLFDIARMPA